MPSMITQFMPSLLLPDDSTLVAKTFCCDKTQKKRKEITKGNTLSIFFVVVVARSRRRSMFVLQNGYKTIA